jgi:Uma2 family endonuclease
MSETVPAARDVSPEPEWEVARLFPARGEWSEGEYLSLPTERRVELSDGCLEILPLPTELHQDLVVFLFGLLTSYVNARRLGKALPGGHPVRLWAGKMREPDVQFMKAEHAHRRKGSHWEGADLVMEIVSPEGRHRDLQTKRSEYALAGIPESWVILPEERRIMVLALDGEAYRVHSEAGPGGRVESALLPGFSVQVEEAFRAGDGGAEAQA